MLISELTEYALQIDFDPPVNQELFDHIANFADQLKAHFKNEILELVISHISIMLVFNDEVISVVELTQQIEEFYKTIPAI